MRYVFSILFILILLPCRGQQDSVPEFSLHDPLINKKGKIQIPSSYYKNIAFDQDLAKVILKERVDGLDKKRIGFINTKGKFVIEPRYLKAEKSSYGIIALLNEEEGWEFYKTGLGKIKQEVVFHDYRIVAPQFILVCSKNKWGILIVTKKQNELVSPIYKNIEYVSANVFKRYYVNTWTLKNIHNEELQKFAYDSVSFFKDSLLVYKLNKASGVIDFEGKELSESFYEKPGRQVKVSYAPKEDTIKKIKIPFEIQRIKGKNKYAILDSAGKEIIHYDSIKGPYANIYVVFNEGQMGIIDNDGIILSELSNRFQKIFPFYEGRAKIIKAGKYGFIDQRGNVRVAPQYTQVRDFKEGLAAVVINGKWGFIDKDENIIVQPHYSEVADFKNGIARAKVSGKWYFVTKEGKKLSNAYDEIKETGIDKWELIKNKKKGLSDKNGKELLAPRYEFLEDLENEMVIVKKDDKWGVVDYSENFIFPIEYDYASYNRSKKLFLFMKKGKEEQVEITSGILK